MKKKQLPAFVIILIVASAIAFIFLNGNSFDLPKGDTRPLSTVEDMSNNDAQKDNTDITEDSQGNSVEGVSSPEKSLAITKSMREIFVTDDVKHSIPVDEIRQGCFGRDCIRSVDNPVFVSKKEADGILPEDTVGIGLIYNGETRFYPFNMLVTREIVNDTIGGHPVVVTYCPLCGTGIVFNGRIGDRDLEFGVSGMLWQSNLLMYNREDKEEDISLWSQVLGEAVLGADTGIKLRIIPSDVVKYEAWSNSNPDTMVLNTGRIGDPYNGNYYGVAKNFSPNYDEANSLLPPTTYVFGIQINGKFKAYSNESLSVGTTNDTFASSNLKIVKESDGVVRFFEEGNSTPIEVVTGFWFSWIAAHPETELFN